MSEPREYPEGHDVLVSKGPCPECSTQKGNATYADGHAKCFSCGHVTKASPVEHTGVPEALRAGSSGVVSLPQHGGGLLQPNDKDAPWGDLSKRGLTSATLRRFGYFKAGFKGHWVGVAPYFDQEGQPSAQKLRFPNKEFLVLKAHDDAPPLGQCLLYGQQVFGDKYDRMVVITEGEIDAMTVAQCCDFGLAVVSLPAGAQNAKAALQKNYRWLDRFQSIVLWFDDDEPGRDAFQECAPLFQVGKVKAAKVPGFKDASDVLQANRPGDVKAAVYAATAWRPQGIINASGTVAAVLAPKEKVLAYEYPHCMVRLQEMTGGMFPGEVTYQVAGTGAGKSTVLREMQYRLIEQAVKIGVLSFEDTIRDAAMGLMSVAESERLQLLPVPDPEDVKAIKLYDARMSKVHAKVFGGGLVELFDPESAEWAMDAILGYVRYCCKALECKVLFIDPISFVAAGLDLSADERRVLDKVAGEFAKLAKELNVHLQIAHHLKRKGEGVPHEEGASTSLNELRSSGGLANFATCVIGWERNNQASDDGWRVVRSRIIKPNRRTGASGIADLLYYQDNGRLVPSTIPFPPEGKPKDGDDGNHSRRGGFTPMPTEEY